MYLEDLNIGAELIVKSVGFDNKVEFNTKIISKNGHKVLLDAIRKDNRLINFKSDFVKTDLQYNGGEDNAIFIFENADIENIYLKDEEFAHRISSRILGTRLNRRSVIRFSLDKANTCLLKTKDNTEYANIKDVSVNGMCVISNIKASEGEIISIDFTDNSVEKKKIHLLAKIVRVDENKNFKNVYGCQLIRMSSDYEKYVMSIQRSKRKIKIN